ncbi:MAG: hypothetical protein PHH85_02095 [Candidatus Methanoperedens sp.]|nr:hypothetical protein [Candidatus Methanoperedens sp.]
MSENTENVPQDQLNIRVPEKLHFDFKMAATKNRTTESALIRDFMAKYLADTNKPVIY